MPTEEEFMPSISRWGHEFTWDHYEVHFVHVIQKMYEVNEISVHEVPDTETLNKMKASNLSFFKKKAQEILPQRALSNTHFEILYHQSPAEALVEYVKKIDANMVVIATRNKKGFAGFFSSSFADKMLDFAPCDILVLRPSKS
jgi:nucleotide-binding universal stress UspA family protein